MIDELTAAEPAPRDRCRHVRGCAAEALACAAFGMFLGSEGRRRWQLAPRVLTRARFEAAVGKL